MSKTVAIFGAGGKLGRRALALCAERGWSVRALVHRTPVEGPGITAVRGSITDPAAVEETVRGADLVVQLATTKEDADTFFDVSVKGTFHVLEACRKQGVEQFLLLGGDAAYGIWFYPQPIPIDENHPLTAYPGYYAFSKVMEETMAQQYAVQYGLPVTVLRSSWVFEGTDLLRHFSLLQNVNPAEPGHGFGEITDEILALVKAGEERIPILTDAQGTPLRRHIVHIDDVMQAFGLILGNPAANGQAFNIASPSPFDYRIAADYLSETLAIPTIEIRCPDYHPFEINITRARTVLGYAPENDFFRMADRAVGSVNGERFFSIHPSIPQSLNPSMRQFHHIGLPTDESQPGEFFVEDTRVWVTDPRKHPYSVEYLRFEADSPVTGPVRDMPHVAYRVDDLEAAIAGEEVILEPFEPSPNFTVAFILKDGAVIEYMKFDRDEDLPW